MWGTSSLHGLLVAIPPLTPFWNIATAVLSTGNIEGGIDCYSSLPFTSQGYRWVVTAVDHLNRYAQADPPGGWAVEVAEALPHCTFLRHGPRRALMSYCGI